MAEPANIPNPVAELHRRLDALEKRGGPPYDGGMEARLAKVEAHVDHMRTDVGEIKSDLRRLLAFLIGGFVLTWSGLIGLGLIVLKVVPH